MVAIKRCRSFIKSSRVNQPAFALRYACFVFTLFTRDYADRTDNNGLLFPSGSSTRFPPYWAFLAVKHPRQVVSQICVTISVFLRAARRFWPAGNPRFPAENPSPASRGLCTWLRLCRAVPQSFTIFAPLRRFFFVRQRVAIEHGGR